MLLAYFAAAAAAARAATIPWRDGLSLKRRLQLRPIMNGINFPDPSIVRTTDGWHIFSTNAIVNGKRVNVQAAHSPDFHTWIYRDGYDALPKLPAWVDWNLPQVWAPDVSQLHDATFILYFAAMNRFSGHHCVGRATSSNVNGPFVDHNSEPWICDLEQGGAIDPSGYLDHQTGRRYIVYKVDGNSIGHGGVCGNTVKPIVPTPIMLQDVDQDGRTLVGPAVQILDRNKADGPYIEAPSLTHMGGKYILFYSSGCFATPKYDVTYAVADNIRGPYKRYEPLFATGNLGMVAPGGTDIAVNGNHLVWHANWGSGRAAFTAVLKLHDSHKFSVSAEK